MMVSIHKSLGLKQNYLTLLSGSQNVKHWFFTCELFKEKTCMRYSRWSILLGRGSTVHDMHHGTILLQLLGNAFIQGMCICYGVRVMTRLIILSFVEMKPASESS